MLFRVRVLFVVVCCISTAAAAVSGAGNGKSIVLDDLSLMSPKSKLDHIDWGGLGFTNNLHLSNRHRQKKKTFRDQGKSRQQKNAAAIKKNIVAIQMLQEKLEQAATRRKATAASTSDPRYNFKRAIEKGHYDGGF